MANTTKRIRYRRVVLTRPFYQPVKIRKTAGVEASGEPKQQAQKNTTPKQGQNLAQNAAHKGEQASQKALSSAAKTEAKTSEEPHYEQSPVASFEPGNNPYAYMISQLPTILEGIPNLLTPVDSGEETVDAAVDATVELASEPEPTIEPEVMPELAPELALETELTSEPEQEQAQRLEPEPKPEPEPKVAPELDLALEPLPEPEFAPERESNLKPKLKPKFEPKPKAKKATKAENPSVTSGLWFGWQNATQDHQQEHPLAAAFMRAPVVRAFPWPGLPERSCRLVRFGGNTTPQASVNAPAEATSGNVESIASQLEALARAYHVELPLLLLFLSSPKQVQQHLHSSALSDSLKPCLSVPSIRFKELTVQHYFEQAMNLGLIAEVATYPACVIEQLLPSKPREFSLNQLPQWIAQLPANSAKLLVKLSISELTTNTTIKNKTPPLYAAFIGEQVQLYGVTRKPMLLNRHHFLSHLTQHLELQPDKAAMQLTVTVYQQPDDLAQRLDERFRLAAEQWHFHWSTSFCQFVNLPY